MCGSVRLKRVTALTGQSWRVRSRLMPRFLIMGFSLLSRAGLASLHRVACSLQLQTKLSPRTRIHARVTPPLSFRRVLSSAARPGGIDYNCIEGSDIVLIYRRGALAHAWHL